MEIDKSTAAQNQRQQALEFAISEIAAYKASNLSDDHTAKLIASANAIFAFISEGAPRK